LSDRDLSAAELVVARVLHVAADAERAGAAVAGRGRATRRC
jgi:hypothetical protein